jgi:predicted amidophosphoribosyltransferase
VRTDVIDRDRLRRWRGRAADFLFPPRCAVCAADGALLCDDCRAAFTPAAPPRCARCWNPSDDPAAAICARCRLNPPPLRSLRAAFVFQGAARRAVLAVKYQHLTATAAPMLEGADLTDLPPDVDLVTAVPMPGGRRRRRGYNQAAVFGRLLAERLGRPFDERALRRRRRTPQQVRQPNRAARLANVRGAFAADPGRVDGRAVLVVDDVTTSGATLNACAEVLLAAGAAAVDGWAVARED